ncbi:hypothetical protein CF15_05295 [Pyrodictium occultum]|uniref:HD/PDEase domain-containing protein n=1 Tax=Pyrodictium occultum TaxID=2309 RepID=A0A0V8RVW0_PYROC|nr:HD domain-containing protein [Pyrodictium occultum]KSW12177.1 hypothetical protein CF15_05295 [Pyrodictium occultum]
MAVCTEIKSFKDPVHGYVDLCSRVAEVVDTWPVQRLRGIRQTAFAYLVYHGMEHSRFNHSLGSAHLAREVLHFLAGNTRIYYWSAGGPELAGYLLRAQEVFQLAALVHDIGHLPYSHSSETGIADARLLYRLKGFDRLPLRHEEYTYSLLPHVARDAEEAGIEPVFTGSVASDLTLILKGSAAQPGARDMLSECTASILHQLIAGGLDVDRMDYLIRDSLYAGVRYGVFDVDRLIRVLLATPLLRDRSDAASRLSRNACRVMVLDKGVSVVEAFLLARLYMFSEVYLHRVVEAYNSVYSRLFSLLARDGLICVEQGCELDIPTPQSLAQGREEALMAWRSLDDTAMWMLIRSVYNGKVKAGEEARRLAAMLVERRHPRVYRVIESGSLWGLYTRYLEEANAPPWAKPLLEELLEMQRENPLLMIRPLRVDLISLEHLGVYSRRLGAPLKLDDERERDHELARLKRFTGLGPELGLYRIAVFTTREHEEEAEKASKLLESLEKEEEKAERA